MTQSAGLDDVEVVLNHQTVLPWSTRRWSTSSSLRRRPRSAGRSSAHRGCKGCGPVDRFGELGGELDPLGFAPRKVGAGCPSRT